MSGGPDQIKVAHTQISLTQNMVIHVSIFSSAIMVLKLLSFQYTRYDHSKIIRCNLSLCIPEYYPKGNRKQIFDLVSLVVIKNKQEQKQKLINHSLLP